MEQDVPELTNDLKALAAELDALGGNAARGEAVADAPPSLEAEGFTVLAPLGRGGMGAVYRARQESLGRDVAVKVLDAALGADPAERERFLNESRTVASLHHPNIVHVYAAGESGGRCWFAMELVTGRTADEHAFASCAELASFAATVAEALAYAHRCGVLHRDVKPSNVFVGDDGSVKLGDFGIACLAGAAASRDGSGTGRYMAPEQAVGEATELSDQYSLGVTVRALAESCLPASERPDADFAAILTKASNGNPALRYPGMDELIGDLRRYLAHEPVAARYASPWRRARLFARRNPLAASGIVAAALLLAAFVASLAVGYVKTSRALEETERARAQTDKALAETRREAAEAARSLAAVLTEIERGEGDRRDAELLRAVEIIEGLSARFPDDPVIQESAEALRIARERHSRFKAIMQRRGRTTIQPQIPRPRERPSR